MRYIKTFEVNIGEPRFSYDTLVKMKHPNSDHIFIVDFSKYDYNASEWVYYVMNVNIDKTSLTGGIWAKESNLRFLTELEKDMEKYNL